MALRLEKRHRDQGQRHQAFQLAPRSGEGPGGRRTVAWGAGLPARAGALTAPGSERSCCPWAVTSLLSVPSRSQTQLRRAGLDSDAP